MKQPHNKAAHNAQAGAVMQRQKDAASADAQAQYDDAGVKNAVSPAHDLSALGPLVYGSDLVAYKPAAPWSGVPGCGAANLAYVPDFLLTGPEWFAGNTVLVKTPTVVTQKPYAVVASKQVLEGIGGIQAGQTMLQQLLDIQLNLNNTQSMND